MKYFSRKIKAALLGIAILVGCASSHVYKGAVGNAPIVTYEQFRHVDSVSQPQFPHWSVGNTIMHVANPSYREMRVLVDCDPTIQPSFSGTVATGGTRTTLSVAPRTVQDLLLLPEDASCLVVEQ